MCKILCMYVNHYPRKKYNLVTGLLKVALIIRK